MTSRSQSLRRVLASASIGWLGLFANGAYAQQSSGSGTSSRDLPAVVVNPPNPRAASAPSKPGQRAASSGASRQPQRAARTTAVPSKPPVRSTQNVQPGQDPRGPINGYVAERSLTGTKTNTPLMETPQATPSSGVSKFAAKIQTASQKHCDMRRVFAAKPLAPIHAMTGSRFAGSMRRMQGCFSTGCSFPVLRLPHGNSSRSASSASTFFAVPQRFFMAAADPGDS